MIARMRIMNLERVRHTFVTRLVDHGFVATPSLREQATVSFNNTIHLLDYTGV